MDWDSAIASVGTSPFYDGLGLREIVGLVPLGENPMTGLHEFWHAESDTPSLSLQRGGVEVTRGLHLAFAAADRSAVDAFFAAALAAGGTKRHAPRYWPEYRAYCAFVSDPDGNNIEAIHKEIGARGR